MAKAKILVVDDDPKLSKLVKLYLERTSLYEVTEENRSSQAVETARRIRPAAILLDFDMPGKDGGEVALELGRDALLQDRPLLFLTSLAAPGASNRRVLPGQHPSLGKPVDPEVLVAAVARLIQSEQPSV